MVDISVAWVAVAGTGCAGRVGTPVLYLCHQMYVRRVLAEKKVLIVYVRRGAEGEKGGMQGGERGSVCIHM